uniref:Xylulose kinase-1 n=1 Tax=Tanacetum cinerariifolium TaxID=118510 RepID=A0A6L2LTK1_TANCI|nr:hypothetical protein [Tanacetum cinerariifolium]
MVAYLSKSDASEGFNQILDFLNKSSIKYALMVNPNIYVSCIKQFWNTVAIKLVNDVTRLQALVDKKKVVVTEAAIRECMSAKRTSWNEFSSSMASAVICLSTDQEADEKGDADEHVKEVTAGDDAHRDDSAAHGEVPTVTQKPSIPSPTSPTPPLQPPQDLPSTSQVQQTPPQSPQGDETGEEEQGRMIVEMDQDDVVVLKDDKEEYKEVANKDVEEVKVDESAQEDENEPAEVQEVVDVVATAKLITEVITAANEIVTVVSAIIPTAEPQVPTATLTVAPARIANALSRRRKRVEPKPLKKKQQIKMDEQYARELHAELKNDIDWDKAIDHVKRKAKEDPAVKRYQVLKRKPQTQAQARKNMIMYLKNVDSFKMDYFKGMSYDDIRPIFEAKFNSNVAFLLKIKEQIEEEENRALQKINETPAERAAKRRKLDEEVEDLKSHLEIVPNEDDDVYTEATPLARKVPVVDYDIIELNNKPYYKIIRANETHQLYVSLLSLLRNFDREDLEALWNLVKERFSTSKPKNFSDDFLLVTLGAMFETPDAHAQI